jgi:hypothetical protein
MQWKSWKSAIMLVFIMLVFGVTYHEFMLNTIYVKSKDFYFWIVVQNDERMPNFQKVDIIE